MNRRFISIVLGLALCAGCGDPGGKRRQASGSAAGAGLVGSDINAPAAPAVGSPPAVGAAPAVGAGLPTEPPTQAAGSLPGLPGVTLPGQPQPSPSTSPPSASASPPLGPVSRPSPAGVVSEKAQAGVTGKGNYGPGAVTTPISVYFQAQERLIFLQVDQALNLYEASQGAKPKTEEEFMKQIIEANRIRLPQLPPGSKYKYDPQKGELQVEHPQ